MADRKIDYDRGVIIKQVPGVGMDVFMYVDDPGVYLTAHGTVVAEGVAKAAGYDTDKLLAARLKKERLAHAADIIEKEFNANENTATVVAEFDGFKLQSVGDGGYIVREPDGDVLTRAPMAKEAAVKLIGLMLGREVTLEEKKEVDASANPNADVKAQVVRPTAKK